MDTYRLRHMEQTRPIPTNVDSPDRAFMATANPCPVFDSTSTVSFFHRPSVPVQQNLLLPSREAARRMVRGDLSMYCCAECGFIFNGSFDPSLLNYGEDYDNT